MRIVRFLIPVLLGLGGVCFGQEPLACTVNSSTNNPVRFEGMTELLNDMVVTCTGGIPTPVGAFVPTIIYPAARSNTLNSGWQAVGTDGVVLIAS